MISPNDLGRFVKRTMFRPPGDEYLLEGLYPEADTPIFQIFCPECGKMEYEGVLRYGLEDSGEACPQCGCYRVDLWDHIITIKGTGIYAIHTLWTNDPPTELEFLDVMAMFLFQQNGHGSIGYPFYSTSIKEVIEFNRHNDDPKVQIPYVPAWYGSEKSKKSFNSLRH